MLRETLLSYMLVIGKRKHFKKKKSPECSGVVMEVLHMLALLLMKSL